MRSPIIFIRLTLTFSIFGGFRSKGENRPRSVEAWFESVEYCAISERMDQWAMQRAMCLSSAPQVL